MLALLTTIPIWVTGALLRRPATWLWFLTGLAFWPLIVRFSGLGLTTTEGALIASVYEAAFISIQVGGILGLGLLDRNSNLLLRTGQARRLLAECLGFTTACLLAVAASLITPAALGLVTAELQLARLPLHLTAALSSYVLIAMVVLHLPLGRWTRTALLPFLTWFLPALILPNTGLSHWIQRVFGIASRLLPDEIHSQGLVSSPWNGVIGLLTLLGWALLAWVTIPSHAREYALRDPR